MGTGDDAKPRTQVRLEDYRTFVVGGAPRSLAASETSVCVGLRNGGVAIFPAFPKGDFVKPTMVEAAVGMNTPARALCHVEGRWWLLAGPDRTFHWLEIDDQHQGKWSQKPITPASRDKRAASAVPLLPTHIACLYGGAATHIIVSYTRSDQPGDTHQSYVYHLEKSGAASAPPKLKEPKVFEFGRLCTVTRIRDAGDALCWLLIGYTGEMWLLARSKEGYSHWPVTVSWGGGTESQEGMSDDFQPGLVTDVAGIRDPDGTYRNEAVVSTDAGAFIVTVDPFNPSKALKDPTLTPRATSRRLDHAGVRGIPLGIAGFTIAADDPAGKALVWCHDSLGGAHLYEANLATKAPIWNRIQSSVRPSPVVQALALRAAADTPIVLWQNCRDETVEVAWYAPFTPSDFDGTNELPSALNAIGSLHAAARWLAEQYPDLKGADPSAKPATADAEREERDLWAPADADRDPEALLADLFDPLPTRVSSPARAIGHTSALWEFLAHPSITLAIEAIEAIRREEKDSAKRADRLRESVDLWAQTLLGSVHSHSRALPTEELALGVVRWLHRLRTWAGRQQTPDHTIVANAAENALFDVRRWTLFAPQSAESARQEERVRSAERRPYRLAIAAQVSRHRKRDLAREENRHQLEEQIVKESVLFKHRVDDEAWELQNVSGLSYHVARIDSGNGRVLCAVLWRQDRIRLFVVDHEGHLSSRREHDIVVGEGKRFGRGVALWKSPDGKLLLLTSIRDQNGERLIGYRVGLPEEAHSPELLALSGAVDLGKDTLTCVRVVDPERPKGLMLMGLRREDGEARIVVLEVVGRTVLDRPITLREAHGASIPNPVHSLHCVDRGGRLRIVAGCDDGTIYLVNDEVPQAHAPEGHKSKAHPIARMAAPIWSIRCREVHDRRLRVYAGTADGHIGAWQELPSAGERPSFARLWCTQEADSIVGLWIFPAYLDRPKSRDSTRVVLAVARNGRATLFADEEAVASREHDALSTGEKLQSERLNRPRVPGQRLERFKLRSSAFSAAHMVISLPPLPPPDTPDTIAWPIARMLVVTGGAAVRVVGLHQPKRSGERRQVYTEHLGKLWLGSICTRTGDQYAVRQHRLRYPEALRALAPALWLLPIPYFLLNGWSQCAPLLAVPVRWYPRYLRPYVRCAHAHRRITQALTSGEEFDADTFVLNSKALASNIDACLRNAYELGDKVLFEEIVENLEKRFNAAINGVCERGGDDRAARDKALREVYESLLDSLERACRQWLATDVEAYAHVQTVRIKNLVDGAVLHALAKNQDQRPELLKLMYLRIRHVQHLLQDGNPLVPLEALRAVNFSLLRACWLSRDEDPVWPDLTAFIEVVGAFAAQSAASAGDALAYEVARVYALCTLLSPREAIRVAISMRAAGLPQAIVDEVKAQHKLLRELLGPDPAVATAVQDQELIRKFNEEREVLTSWREKAARMCEHSLEHPPGYPEPPTVVIDAARESAALEHPLAVATLAEWEQWADAFRPCLQVLYAFKDATLHLRHAPERVSFRAIGALKDELKDDAAPPDGAEDRAGASNPLVLAANEKRSHYKGDRAFLRTGLADLDVVCSACGVQSKSDRPLPRLTFPTLRRERDSDPLRDDERPVTPAVVLASTQMGEWARAALGKLGEAKLMEPQLSLYRAALEDFRAVTDELRSSSSVQRRLVTGVLGHHLMEALEEHVLRLFETAHVLYPPFPRLAVGEAPDGTLGSHAKDLLDHAEHARSIPKNLRSLYQLLRPGGIVQDENIPVAPIYRQIFGSEIPHVRLKAPSKKKDITVDARVAAALGLILGELASNHRVHGRDDEVELEVVSAEKKKRQLKVRLPVHQPTAESAARLVDVALHQMQAFLRPAKGVEESSGVGLYLANLAASTVGWRLEIDRGDEVVEFVKQKNASSEATPGKQQDISIELSGEQYPDAAGLLVNGGYISFVLSEVAP